MKYPYVGIEHKGVISLEWYINKTWRKGFNVGLFKVDFGEKTLYYLDVFTTGGITGNNYPDKAAGALQINVLK